MLALPTGETNNKIEKHLNDEEQKLKVKKQKE